MPTAVPPISPPGAVASIDAIARTPVRQIMRSGVVSVIGNASLLQGAKALSDHGVRAVLVLHTGSLDPVGWLTSRAVLEQLLEYSPFVPIADAVTETVTTIAPSATVADAIEALTAPGVTHLLVVNGAGAAQGVVSDADIVRLVATRT